MIVNKKSSLSSIKPQKSFFLPKILASNTRIKFQKIDKSVGVDISVVVPWPAEPEAVVSYRRGGGGGMAPALQRLYRCRPHAQSRSLSLSLQTGRSRPAAAPACVHVREPFFYFYFFFSFFLPTTLCVSLVGAVR